MRQKQETAKKPKEGMARLLELAMMRKGFILVAAVLAALAALASFVPYIAVYWVIKEVVVVYPVLSSINVSALSQIGAVAMIGVLANVLLYFLSLIFSHIAAYGTICQLKLDFASHLALLPLGVHINMGSGRLRKIMENNIESLEGFIAHDFTNTIAALVAPVVMLVISFVVDWRFGFMVLLGIVVAFVVQGALSPGEKSKILVKEYQAALEDMSGASVEYVRGISVVKAFGQTAFSFKRLSDSIKNYTSSVVPHALSQENMMAGFTTAINSIYLFLLPMGILIGSRTSDFPAFVTTFCFYLIFVPAVGPILMKIVYVMVNANKSAVNVKAIDDILTMPPLPEPDHSGKPTSYDVAFKHVDFTYDGANEKALCDVSFLARQGQITAIVGASGGGKSTIASLIPRFYDVQNGSITIGNVDIRDMKMEALMDYVGFVFQDSFLFKQSIMENIRIGRPDASMEDVVAAATAAQCDVFIQALPDGYDTVYGENGIYLSGGEIQRIAIARAILKNAPILVLDEATAFADPENEYLIQQALEKLMKGKTVIMIAHRLSTVRDADQILVMEDGTLQESGTEAELLAKKGRYHALWSNYTEALDWELIKEGVTNA